MTGNQGLDRRGFLKGIFGAVALIAAAPALRVADAVLPGPPPPQPKFKVPSPKQDRRIAVFKRYDSAVAVKATDRGPLPVPDGWLLCDGRVVPKGTYRELELALSRNDVFPYGATHRLYRLPGVRGAA